MTVQCGGVRAAARVKSVPTASDTRGPAPSRPPVPCSGGQAEQDRLGRTGGTGHWRGHFAGVVRAIGIFLAWGGGVVRACPVPPGQAGLGRALGWVGQVWQGRLGWVGQAGDARLGRAGWAGLGGTGGRGTSLRLGSQAAAVLLLLCACISSARAPRPQFVSFERPRRPPRHAACGQGYTLCPGKDGLSFF
eukprot:gene7560-biopygen4560